MPRATRMLALALALFFASADALPRLLASMGSADPDRATCACGMTRCGTSCCCTGGDTEGSGAVQGITCGGSQRPSTVAATPPRLVPAAAAAIAPADAMRVAHPRLAQRATRRALVPPDPPPDSSLVVSG